MGPPVPARSWTLMGLILAFLDLSVAYFLLCISAVGFFFTKLCGFFLFFIPCPCIGLLDFVDSRLCLRKNLIGIPLRIILVVHVLIRSRFPFTHIYYDEQECTFKLKDDRNRGFVYGFLDLDGEVCSGSGKGLISRGSRDRGTGGVKGKGLMSQKQQKSIRRRRRVALGNGNHSLQLRIQESSGVTGRVSFCGDSEVVRNEVDGSLDRREENFQGDENSPFCTNILDKSWHSFYLGEPFEVENSASIDYCADNIIQETQEASMDEADKIKMLEKALEEVQSAYNVLLLELEKERAAAATAADEAMAMILRLQDEKASIEMEVRQEQRMIEEKFTYDEEEMNILKEILVRREMENFVLEKEVENLKQMVFSSDRNLEECSQDADIRVMVPQVVNDGTNREKALYGSNNLLCCSFSPEVSQREILETDTSMLPDIITTSGETCKCLSCDSQEPKHGDYEVPQEVYDVHVIDDMNEQSVKKIDKRGSAAVISYVGRRGSLVHEAGVNLLTVDSERLRLDSEVECLREMLWRVQEEKEKLKIAA
ncbi:hypothetical protein SAY87_000898 [Trapa incisa]|uniref:GTD-binding domain-containing protein n=1 Tax=Trapa incisa TaxID=236973 RepID=A0AAN7JGZ4_9MYRT|nr:hypothetical protein SAY87_000898 [Trapa incisa]